jgi:hypothetical protein
VRNVGPRLAWCFGHGRADRWIACRPLNGLERVKGIEPSSSAWKSFAAAAPSRPIQTKGLHSHPLAANVKPLV